MPVHAGGIDDQDGRAAPPGADGRGGVRVGREVDMGSAAGLESFLADAREEAFDGAVVEQWWGCYGWQVQVDVNRVALGGPDPVVPDLESLLVGAGGKAG